MRTVAIRCRPGPPRSTAQLDTWIQAEVERLRCASPRITTRLARLTDDSHATEEHVGWLIELGLPDAQTPVGWGRLVGVLRDMELLGLQPTVMTVAGGLGARPAAIARPKRPKEREENDDLAM